MDDSTLLYETWKETGVDITLELWEDMWHVWHQFAAQLPEGREAVDKLAKFVRDRLEIV
jgi:monoterpene epsilon-lactone hydrolase